MGEPAQGFIGHFLCGSPKSARDVSPVRKLEIIPIRVKSVAEASARGQHVGTDKRTSLIAAYLEDLGKSRLTRIQHEPSVIPYTVTERKAAGKETGVRRQGQRCRSRGLFEQDSFARQPIDIRRGGALESICTETVGASRIEGDEEHVEVRPGHASRKRAQPRPINSLSKQPERADSANADGAAETKQRQSEPPEACHMTSREASLQTDYQPSCGVKNLRRG